jgi:hypothetical protein
MEAFMFKKMAFLLLAFIFCISLSAQPIAAATQNDTLHKTILLVDTRWDTGNNIFDPTIWLYTESYVIDEKSGKQLDHQNLRYELYNPNGVLCEVQKHKTGRAWYNLQREICAKADFEGPFNGGLWTLKVIYDGNEKDHFAPCEKTLHFSHENRDWIWGGSD